MSQESLGPSVREARSVYFRDNQFGDDGGYGARWVRFQLGTVPLAIPNTAARVRAVAYHDLHHIATGYTTNHIGEFEISAWEIGAGCKGYGAAWLINLGGLAAGLFICPRRTVAAFLRGRAEDTLYGRDVGALLDQPVALLAELTGAARPRAKMTVGNLLRLLLAGAAGLVAGLLLGAVGLLAAPVLALLGAHAAPGGDTAPVPAPDGAHGPAS